MARSTPIARALSVLPLTALLACSSANDANGDPAHEPGTSDAGAKLPSQPKSDAGSTQPRNDAGAKPELPKGGKAVELTPPAAEQAAFSALLKSAQAAEKLDLAGVRAKYPLQFRESLSYDPAQAEFLDRIQASSLALSDGELGALGKNGFVISQRREFPTFLRGLAEIYASHLPLYVSADALLETVHSSYDQILLAVEQRMLIPELRKLLVGMRSRLKESSAAERADADLYLTVALSLLEGKSTAPVAGADAKRIEGLVAQANKADGQAELTLFGVQRQEDFSQFKPRGHYTGDPQLEGYFRALIWLGRVDLRLIETMPDGSQVFRRPQYLATLLLHDLVGSDLPSFQRIDTTIRTFVGESDYMVLAEVEKLIVDLGGAEAARTKSDAEVAQAILAGGYGKQQIASHIMVNDGTVPTLPLNRSFALLGQRYVVDSHVFSELVYDRFKAKRMMPSPLDAAFAALGNAQALGLNPDSEKFTVLPGALARMRVLVDDHAPSFWEANLYNLWLSALRGLSPAGDLTDPGMQGLPQIAGTDAWGRRLLNAQLGSWAELRHDTILYAKQSYTGTPACDFPDAYVDPYPEVFRALEKYAGAGARVAELVAEVDSEFSGTIVRYFALLSEITGTLADMAERERRGEPFTSEQLALINRAVRVERKNDGCVTIDVPDGWYADLFFVRDKSIEFDPTIADVHTQPADEAGNTVGKVLHVGTGYPRLMVATVDSCQSNPRAYAGVVYAYHEQVTKDFERLTDEEWAKRFAQNAQRPEDVAWLKSVLAK